MNAHARTDIVDAVAIFCREVIAPKAAEIDETGRFAGLHRTALAEMGFFGLNLPEALGGVGIDPFTLFECVALLAGACGSTAFASAAH